MYPISVIYADYLKRHDREFLVKAVVDGKTYDSSVVVDFSIENSLALNEEFEIGTTIPSELTIRLRTQDVIPPNGKIVPYLSISTGGLTWAQAAYPWSQADIAWSGGGTEWLPLGEFYVDDRQRVNDVWTFTCYDKLIWADAAYVSSLTFPATQQAVWNEICGLLGYQYNSSVVINTGYTLPVAPTGYSMRQVMGYIAASNAASLFVGKDGLLRFKRFTGGPPTFTLTVKDYNRVTQTNPVKSYSRVVVTADAENEVVYEAGSGDENHTLYVDNPFATQAMTNAILVSLAGFSYLPITMDSRGFPHFDQGDEFTFQKFEGRTWLDSHTAWANTDVPWNGVSNYQSIILHQKMDFKGGLKLSIEAPSISEQQSEFEVPGALADAINNLDKTTLKEGKNYYGFSASRETGLIVEREDHMSKLTLNSDVMNWQVNGQSALYYDAQANRLKLNGTLEAVDGTFTGSLSAATGTFAGDLSAAGGTFRGALQAASGTFTGELVAASGTFRGALQAATGTFAGNLSAAGGTFTGNLSAAGGTFTGALVAASGSFSGEISASTITGGTITGAKYQTSSTVYPRVVIDPTSIAFGVYADVNSSIQIPAYDGGVSKILFNNSGGQSVIYNSPASGFIFSGSERATVTGAGVKLDPRSDYVRVPSWAKLYSEASYSTLQAAFDEIWAYIYNHTHTVSLGTHNHGNVDNLNWGGTFTTSTP